MERIKDRVRLGAVALALVLGGGACAAPAPEQPSPRPAPAPAPSPPAADTAEEGPLGDPVWVPAPMPADSPAPWEEEPEGAFPDTAAVEDPDLPIRRPYASVPVLANAVLPRQRIVAFYGNPASTRMGILGEVPPDEMLRRLDEEVARWRAADPATPVQPALHLIAVMATGDPGADSLFRLRLPDRLIGRVMDWANRRDALVFLDIQAGLSDIPSELPRLEDWLRLPDVHLALDPEWMMPEGSVPGARIGTMGAEDVNYAIDYLAGLVDRYDLPPKVLVVHRFTQSMLRDAERIRMDPRVQVVINMDGWGPPSQKIHAYRDIVAPEAEQFTGFKLFFHNDRKGDSRLMTPEEILRLDPPPIYIQYQ